jgi:hypothetical protein
MEVRWLYSRSDIRRESSRPPPTSHLKIPQDLFPGESGNATCSHSVGGVGGGEGDILEERELFLSDELDDAPLESISYLISVVQPDQFVKEVRAVRKRGSVAPRGGMEVRTAATPPRVSANSHASDDELGSRESYSDLDDGSGSGKEGDKEHEGDFAKKHVRAEGKVYFCSKQYLRTSKRFLDVGGTIGRGGVETSSCRSREARRQVSD